MYHDHHGPKAMVFGLPTGDVGDGPYSVWAEHNGHRWPEAFGFQTSDEAFAHVEKIRKGHEQKMEAIKVLIGDELPDEVKQGLQEAVVPEFKVYRLDPVSRVDISALPKIDLGP